MRAWRSWRARPWCFCTARRTSASRWRGSPSPTISETSSRCAGAPTSAELVRHGGHGHGEAAEHDAEGAGERERLHHRRGNEGMRERARRGESVRDVCSTKIHRIHRAPRRPSRALAPRLSSFLPRPSQRGRGCILGRGHRPERLERRALAGIDAERREPAAYSATSRCSCLQIFSVSVASPRRRRRVRTGRARLGRLAIFQTIQRRLRLSNGRDEFAGHVRARRAHPLRPAPPIVRASRVSARRRGRLDESANRRRHAGHEVTVPRG